MAFEEKDRTMGYKRLYLIPDGQTLDPADDPTQNPDPGSDPYVDIPVIMQISWQGDGSEQYQEYEWTLDNSHASGRGALDNNGNLANSHVDKVFGADTTQNVVYTDANGTQYQAQDVNGNWYQIGDVGDWFTFIKIERADFFPHMMDGSDLYWEYLDGFDNKTGGNVVNQDGDGPGSDTVPPHFINHLKTHIFRYKNPNNAGWWADAEITDKYSRQRDGSDQFQEVEYALNNPDVQADPSWPCLNDTANGIDPPLRIDPFQNIVNWSGAPKFYIQLTLAEVQDGDIPVDSGISWVTDPSPYPVAGFIGSNYIKTFQVQTRTWGVLPSGGPASPNNGPLVTAPDYTPGTWIWCGSGGFGGAGTTIGTVSHVNAPSGSPPLTMTVDFYGVLFADVGWYSEHAAGPPFHWLNIYGGYPYNWPYPPGLPPTLPAVLGPTTFVGTTTVTISSSPFDFNGKNYRAVSLGAFDAGRNAYRINCVPA